MIAKLLKLIPLETLLQAGFTALLSNKPKIILQITTWIEHAQKKIADPGDKLTYVKVHVLDLLKLKSGFLLDTGIQMLVAWFKLKNPAIKFEG